MSQIRVYIALILAMVFWGFSFTGTKFSLDSLHPVWLIFFRLSVSVVFLFILMLVTKRLKAFKKADAKWFILLALFEPFVYFLGETFGVRLVSSILSSVIIATIPLFVAIAGVIFLKKKPGLIVYLGIFFSVIGVLLMVLKPDMSLNADPLGILFLFVAVFAAVGYTLIIFKLVQRYSPLEIIAWENLIGIIFFIPLLFFNPLAIGEITFSYKLVFIILMLGIFPSSLSYMFFNWGVKRLGMNRATIFTNAIPLVTAVIAYFWLGERFTLQNVIGMLIVIVSLTLSQILTKNEEN
ncbi:MAG: hypothetical protein CVU05_02060 [Bacteroidetes bacterium HGW-Bacteroidetes-21]|jgi:drug/metabolite transporter (DMT)-like permease|nr:MAG: hypothetical protein CVU05_02060 [Bacteroidetes bacterium HGW-Bacteroidetes-21]